MGEVYRASDVRLGRQVAVKVLPERFATDSEALARFEREARAVAALSHPGICTLHDVGREGQVPYLVMELLEGETLAERILKGPLALEQVFKIGAEIGAALAAAHERGIAHRDLKPGNVMLTRAGVKLLDFGLAKALEAGDDPGPAPTASVKLDLTQAGTLLGTLPYMAPEQLEGRRADARSDIFALGAVLHEMATGQRAFSGRSQASLISAILASQPSPVSQLRPLSPAGLDQLVRTCLAKDPLERWQSARDVVLQLRALAEAQPPAPAAPGARASWLAWGTAGVATALLVASLWHGRPAQAPPARLIKFTVAPPAGGAFTSWAEGSAIAVSPDGTKLAFAARDAQGKLRLWLRSLDATDAQPLPGSEGADAPFWSPDGRSLGFAAEGKLKRLDLSGGAPISLCDVSAGAGVSATWGKDGILFIKASTDAQALYRVPVSGGQPTVEIAVDRSKGERRIAWPTFLPDGEHYLYLQRQDDYSWHLRMSGPDKLRHEVGVVESAAQFAGPGHLVFVHEGTLVAQPFDWVRGRLSGEPVAISEAVRYFRSTGSAAFSASRAGVLAYQPQRDSERLVWFDRGGRELGQIGAPGSHRSLAISPDGRRVLYDVASPITGTYDVWSWDLAMQVESRLTSHPETEVRPRWLSADAIVFSANLQALPPQLVRRDLATGQERPLLPPGDFRWAEDVSPDGGTLLYWERGLRGTADIWALSLSGPPDPRPVVRSDAEEHGARLSPDGRWLAFVSDESGRLEAYVTPYPGPGEKRRVSANGARALCWRRDGRELLMLAGDGRLWSLPVRASAAFEAGPATLLFAPSGRPWLGFDLAPDGQRILAIVPEIVGNEQPATVVVNWAAP